MGAAITLKSGIVCCAIIAGLFVRLHHAFNGRNVTPNRLPRFVRRLRIVTTDTLFGYGSPGRCTGLWMGGTESRDGRGVLIPGDGAVDTRIDRGGWRFESGLRYPIEVSSSGSR